ncbi:MAG: outer membrane beta-barrel family protein, partial [Bacteroidetes bacterium]|nr:outer membrane beta-barrel family protein [Bacteroidota bacterium]
LNLRYTLWKNGSISGYCGVYSPSIMLQGQSSKYWFTSLNASQELFKKKLTVSLSVSDPFRSSVKYESTIEDPTFHQKSTYIYTNRTFRVNLSYRFGQMKGEIKKAKRGIKNDDVKSGGSSTGTSEGTQQN